MSAREPSTYKVLYRTVYNSPPAEAIVTAHYVRAESNKSVTFSNEPGHGHGVVAYYDNVISVEKQESK